jgi:hypothetical protein
MSIDYESEHYYTQSKYHQTDTSAQKTMIFGGIPVIVALLAFASAPENLWSYLDIKTY